MTVIYIVAINFIIKIPAQMIITIPASNGNYNVSRETS